GIPNCVDIRDLWPDFWSNLAPASLRPAADLFLLPFYLQSRQVLSRFDNICAITDEILQWGLQRASRRMRVGDMAIPHGYALPEYTQSDLAEAQASLTPLVDRHPVPDLRLCYFGNIAWERGRVDVMVRAIEKLPIELRNRVQLLICGSGESLELLKQ